MYRAVLLILVLTILVALPTRRLDADEAPSVKQGVDAIQADINKAIDRGLLWLLEQQQVDGSWGQDSARYPTGMTGLALYTLLKSGVPADTPFMALGFRNLVSIQPGETYALACQLMALGALGHPAHQERMAALARQLTDIDVRGSWSYPFAHEGAGWARRPGNLDLSNTQFAVLGLYAAHRAGIPVSPDLLKSIIRQTRFHQRLPTEVGGTHADGTEREAAGFAYYGPGPSGLGAATGSMTCAGITVLELCRRMAGTKLARQPARQIEESLRRAVTWLEEEWSVEANPGQVKSHKLYYLYGLERVGSLLGLETFGGHAWYAEGAQELLAIQKDSGAWGSASDTAFALLFLLRATKGEVTGARRSHSILPTYATSEESPLRVRATGHSPLQVWITSVRPDLRGRHGQAGHVPFRRVEYLVDDQVEATVAQGPPPHGADATHRVTLHVPHAGTYTVRARGLVDGPSGEVALESAPLTVDVKLVVPPWAFEEAAWMGEDLRVLGQMQAHATSQNAGHQGPERAVDRTTDTFWLCRPKPPDPRPALDIRLKRGVKANAIVLAPAPRREGDRFHFDRPTRFEVVVNGKQPPLVVTPEADELRSTVLRLPKALRVKSLDVAITARTTGRSWKGQSGFREVLLTLEAVAPPTHVVGDDGTCTLACETSDAEIRYTLDGSAPTADSPLYEGPFRWPGRTRLHAVARLPSGESSRLLLATLP